MLPPASAIDFDSARNRSGDVWHIWGKGITSGQIYAYRVEGLAAQLQDEGAKSFVKSWNELLAVIVSNRAALKWAA